MLRSAESLYPYNPQPNDCYEPDSRTSRQKYIDHRQASSREHTKFSSSLSALPFDIQDEIVAVRAILNESSLANGEVMLNFVKAKMASKGDTLPLMPNIWRIRGEGTYENEAYEASFFLSGTSFEEADTAFVMVDGIPWHLMAGGGKILTQETVGEFYLGEGDSPREIQRVREQPATRQDIDFFMGIAVAVLDKGNVRPAGAKWLDD
jgi:hypothetical protein